jgi:anion-transporting  ArsA/GET3 family ATPase
MDLQTLLQKKLVIVTGKGGVGKSTISAALGQAMANQGKKTLIAEIHTEGHLADLFKKPSLQYEPSVLGPNLFGANISPKESFKEYVLMQIKFRQLYRAVFENRLVNYFIEATPGLAELMCIGKVYDLTQNYDMVILDAPATGHGFSLLQVPSVVAGAVRVGPLKTEAEKVAALLQDSQQTMLTVVTLPEEMPVNEACEMATKTRENLGLKVELVVINQTFPAPMTDQETILYKKTQDPLKTNATLQPLITCMEAYLKRYELQQHYIDILHRQFGAETCLQVPYRFKDAIRKDDIAAIAQQFSA